MKKYSELHPNRSREWYKNHPNKKKEIKEQKAFLKECQDEIRSNIDKCFDNPTLKEWQGDDVQVAFKIPPFFWQLVFTGNNWNDRRIHLFRQFFGGWSTGSIRDQQIYIGDLTIVHMWDDDENYVYIFDNVTHDLFHVEWYKDRGRTDLFIKNGGSITLYDFRQLLQKMLGETKISGE